MSVRSFHSVFMATAVAGAALGCYLVSLRVASERAALEEVESQIVQTQASMRLLQTEIGTRARLAQLERWNVRALALSAPTAEQILGDKFQLAKLIRPERKPQLDAPVVLASAPAPPANAPLEQQSERADGQAVPLLHEASYEVPTETTVDSGSAVAASKAAETEPRPSPAKATVADRKKAGDKSIKGPAQAVTRPVRTAKIDPLAPPSAGQSTAKGSHTER